MGFLVTQYPAVVRRGGSGVRRFTALDKGFASCDDPAALQRICGLLGPRAVTGFFWSGFTGCPRRLPPPTCAPGMYRAGQSTKSFDAVLASAGMGAPADAPPVTWRGSGEPCVAGRSGRPSRRERR
jgi:hypothetical protein